MPEILKESWKKTTTFYEMYLEILAKLVQCWMVWKEDETNMKLTVPN